MKLLVAGHKGFVGRHLLAMTDASVGLDFLDRIVDITQQETLVDSIRHHQPTHVIHLAAQSHVPTSFDDPIGTYHTNVIGTLNILTALRLCGFRGKFLYVSSGDTYGSTDEVHLPIKETHIQQPRSPYASSKVSSEVLCKQFSLTEAYDIVIARPFNHIGPGQSSAFVVSSLALQLVRMSKFGESPVLTVGNLSSTRDFSDVRDVVKAYMLLLEKGVAGEIYNVCSGLETSIADVAAKLIELTGINVDMQVDDSRIRKNEQLRVFGCNNKLVSTTGWSPKYSIENSLEDIFQFWYKETNK